MVQLIKGAMVLTCCVLKRIPGVKYSEMFADVMPPLASTRTWPLAAFSCWAVCATDTPVRLAIPRLVRTVVYANICRLVFEDRTFCTNHVLER
jgi:hypothetical protein